LPPPFIPIASSQNLGVVQPDGNSILINSDGVIGVPLASPQHPGIVQPDGNSILINSDGVVGVPLASSQNLGIVQPDGNSILIDSDGVIGVPLARTTTPGIVQPDGTTLRINSSGVMSVPSATNITAGVVKPDGSTIVVNNGLLIALPPEPAIATSTNVGVVKPDGTTIEIDSNGTISTNLYLSRLFFIRPQDENFNFHELTITNLQNEVKITGVNTVNFNTSAIVGSGGSIRIDVANRNLIKVTCFLTFDGRTGAPAQIPGGYNRGYLYWESDDNVKSSRCSVDVEDWNTSVSADFKYPVSYSWTLQNGIDFTSLSEYVELWGFASDGYTLQFFFFYDTPQRSDRILVEYLA
jgi:hypothetical protein